MSSTCLQAGSLLGLFLDYDDGGDIFLRNGLHGVSSKKLRPFITTAARSSNPRKYRKFWTLLVLVI
jgi:hypothetical protein